jgi:hypothetical protein
VITKRCPGDKESRLFEEDDKRRCGWASGPWLIPYHDHEWGVPVHDDRQHLELLALEGAQAGLSWITVLKRRAAYRRLSPALIRGT